MYNHATSSFATILQFHVDVELVFQSIQGHFNFIYLQFLKFKKFLFYLFLAVLGLCCCPRAFSSCGEWGLLFIAVLGLLIAVASHCCGFSLRSTGSRRAGFSCCGWRALECRLSSCGTRAYLLCSMWDLPGPGLEPLSLALAGRFLTTAPPGKPLEVILKLKI